MSRQTKGAPEFALGLMSLPLSVPVQHARVPRARTRLHVNPLSPELLLPPSTPDWPALLALPELPLHLDFGCAYGELVLGLAKREPDRNFVGVELRERVLERASAQRLPNAAFLFGNARQDQFLEVLLRGYKGPLATASVLFPDPYAQPRYKRRRLLQPSLVSAVAAAMLPGAAFVTVTDNLELAEEMAAPFLAEADTWTPAPGASLNGRVSHSPFPVSTAWQLTVEGRVPPVPIYWAHFVRSSGV